MNPLEIVYVPEEKGTVREARCPFCQRVNFIQGTVILGRMTEYVAELGSVVCDHYRDVENSHRGVIKSVIFNANAPRRR